MNPTQCRNEAAIVAAVHAGGWPHAAAELAVHAAGCAVCREVAEVALSFDAERRTVNRHVSVPSAARVWWRAQLRARMDAAEVAAQPLGVAQGLGAASALAVAILSIRWAWPSILNAGTWIDRVTAEAAIVAPVESDVVRIAVWLTLGLALLVLVPVVVFCTMPDE
jgi:hypothetical protein